MLRTAVLVFAIACLAANTAAAQKAVLYEEEPPNANSMRSVGSADWRIDSASRDPNQLPEVAVHAYVEIPERRIVMTMSIRRNNDNQLLASYVVEIRFNLPADFPPAASATSLAS